MNFFLDENLPRRFGPLLSAFDREHTFECHHTNFGAGIPDVDWMSVLGKRDEKPAIVCGDGRILRNPAELAALKDAGLTFVCLLPAWVHMTWHHQAWKMIKYWPEVVKNVVNAKRPSVFDVTGRGKVTLRNLLRDL